MYVVFTEDKSGVENYLTYPRQKYGGFKQRENVDLHI